MNTVIGKEKLMEIIQENRDKHRSVFLEAIDGYRLEAIKRLERMIEKIKKGKTIDQYLRLPVPTDNTNDYDRVLKMMELDTRDEINLNEEEFAQYVLDDWSWKREWIATASNYTSNAL